MDVDQIAGSVVVEIGVRQAWPFLGFADNRPVRSEEARLYVDSTWTIEATTSVTADADDDIAWLTAAAVLNGETIDTARVDEGRLTLTAASGITLVVSGEPQQYTTGEAWRLSGWHPA